MTAMLPCPDCGYVHSRGDVHAMGRFRADGPEGFHADYRIMPDAPIRATRVEAMDDVCAHRAGSVVTA